MHHPAPLLLTAEELQILTGTKQPKRMCDWLKERGWVFEAPSRRGELPKVDRGYYAARMSGQPAPETQRRGRLNLDWMLQPS